MRSVWVAQLAALAASSLVAGCGLVLDVDPPDPGMDAAVADASMGGCERDEQCDDQDPCNGEERCTPSGCINIGPALSCDDGIECTREECVQGMGCRRSADDSLCTDDPGGRCVIADGGCQYPSCTASNCRPGPCQQAMCRGETCVRTMLCGDDQMCCAGQCVSTGCSDGFDCTVDSCDASMGCVHRPNDLHCGDGNDCTVDRCDPAQSAGDVTGCTNTARPGTCNDQNACTGNDRCERGRCTGDSILCGQDSNPCTVAMCDTVLGCQDTRLSNVPCSSGNLCRHMESCTNGVCGGGRPLCPDDGNPCTLETCSPTNGVCQTSMIIGGVCNTNASCTSGRCQCDPGFEDCDNNGSCECERSTHFCGPDAMGGTTCLPYQRCGPCGGNERCCPCDGRCFATGCLSCCMFCPTPGGSPPGP